MTSKAELGDWAPDMFLYHSSNTHYDLLVNETSRIAQMGLLAGATVNDTKELDDEIRNEWQTVKPSYKKSFPSNKEELLVENVEIDDNDIELEEENNLINLKNSGHRRTTPHVSSDKVSGQNSIFKCEICKHELESQGLLDAHM